MAARWEDFADDGDGYLLQYRTAGDDKVRPEHAALNGVTLPKSDSFWDSYYPPNGWNCRCTVVEVLASKYPTTDHNEAMQRGEKALSKDSKGMFRFNPGKQERTFPAYNPYTISRCNGCNLSELAGGKGPDPNNPLCQAHFFIVPEANQAGASARIQKYDKKDWDRTYVSDNNRGLVVTEHRRIEEGKRSKNERAKLEKELRMCKVIADNGHDVELLRIQGRPAGQSYDILLDGITAELKCITGGAGNMFRRACEAFKKQGAEAIVFEIPSREAAYYSALTKCRRILGCEVYFYATDELVLRKVR